MYFNCRYKRILVIISHSQDFLNGICTNTVHLDKKRLKFYGVCVIQTIYFKLSTIVYYNFNLFRVIMMLLFVQGKNN